MPTGRTTGAARAGATWLELACALLVTLVALVGAGFLDRALEHPPAGDLVAIGPVADPHHVHIDAIYGSFAREVAEGGGLRVHNHQTGEPHPPTLARPWDWLVGRLGRALGADSPRALFRLDRFFAALFFPAGLVLLLGETLRGRAARLAALLALCAGGSLYWIGPLRTHCGSWLDSIGGLSGLGFAYPALLLGVPHLALEIAFFAGGLGAAFRARRVGAGGGLLWAAVAGVLLFGLASVRPYTAPAALVGAGVALLWARPRRGLVAAALACVPSLPLLVHDALVLRGDTVFRALAVTHSSPPLLQQLVFVGVPALLIPLFAVPAVRRAASPSGESPASRAGLLAAALVVLALVEGPFVAWQVEAMLPVPLLGLLAAASALEGLASLGPSSRRAAVALGGAALLLHLAPSFAYAREVERRLDDPRSGLWMLRGERETLAYLSELAGGAGLTADAPPIVLLCEPTFGRLVPWLAGVRVFVGHADHTVDFAAKEARARGFFRFGAGAGALRDAGITHVLFAPRTRSAAVDPGAVPGLEPVFASGDVRLFRVTR